MLYRLTVQLQSQGWTSRVICMNAGGLVADKLQEAGVQVIRLQITGFGSLVTGFIRTIRLLRTWRPQVVHTWLYRADLFGGLAAKIAGSNCIIWSIRNSKLLVNRGWGRRMLPRMCGIMSWVLPLKIISCAESAAKVHVVTFGYDSKRIVSIPNGYDPKRFSREAESGEKIRERFDIESDQIVLGVVGRYDTNKAYDVLMNAVWLLIEHYPRMKVLMVGAGMVEENAELMELVKKLGLRQSVVFAGICQDMSAIYSATDLLVSTSVSEGFPNVIAEAMLCECAIVATDVGETREIVGPWGRVIPPRDPGACAFAIEQTLKEGGDVRKKQGAGARARIIDKYGIERVANRYAEAYSRCQGNVRNNRIH